MSGRYLALWSGLPYARRPDTGDFDTEVAVIDLHTGRLVAATAVYSDDQAYLAGGYLALSVPFGLQELRHSLAVFDLARGRWLRRVFPPAVEGAVLWRGCVYVLSAGAHGAPLGVRRPLPTRGWRPAPRTAMVRILTRRPWPRL